MFAWDVQVSPYERLSAHSAEVNVQSNMVTVCSELMSVRDGHLCSRILCSKIVSVWLGRQVSALHFSDCRLSRVNVC